MPSSILELTKSDFKIELNTSAVSENSFSRSILLAFPGYPSSTTEIFFNVQEPHELDSSECETQESDLHNYSLYNHEKSTKKSPAVEEIKSELSNLKTLNCSEDSAINKNDDSQLHLGIECNINIARNETQCEIETLVQPNLAEEDSEHWLQIKSKDRRGWTFERGDARKITRANSFANQISGTSRQKGRLPSSRTVYTFLRASPSYFQHETRDKASVEKRHKEKTSLSLTRKCHSSSVCDNCHDDPVDEKVKYRDSDIKSSSSTDHLDPEFSCKTSQASECMPEDAISTPINAERGRCYETFTNIQGNRQKSDLCRTPDFYFQNSFANEKCISSEPKLEVNLCKYLTTGQDSYVDVHGQQRCHPDETFERDLKIVPQHGKSQIELASPTRSEKSNIEHLLTERWVAVDNDDTLANGLKTPVQHEECQAEPMTIVGHLPDHSLVSCVKISRQKVGRGGSIDVTNSQQKDGRGRIKDVTVNQQKGLGRIKDVTINQQEELGRIKDVTINQQEELGRIKDVTINQQEDLARIKDEIISQPQELGRIKDVTLSRKEESDMVNGATLGNIYQYNIDRDVAISCQSQPDGVRISTNRNQSQPDGVRISTNRSQSQPDGVRISTNRSQSQPDGVRTSNTGNKSQTEEVKDSPIISQSQTEEVKASPIISQSQTEEVKASPIINQSQTEEVKDSPIISQSQTEEIKASPIISRSQTEEVKDSPIINQSQTEEVKDSPIISQSQTEEVRDSPIINQSQTEEVKDSPIISQSQTEEVKDSPIINQSQTEEVKDSPIISRSQTEEVKDSPIINQSQQCVKKCKTSSSQSKPQVEDAITVVYSPKMAFQYNLSAVGPACPRSVVGPDAHDKSVSRGMHQPDVTYPFANSINSDLADSHNPGYEGLQMPGCTLGAICSDKDPNNYTENSLNVDSDSRDVTCLHEDPDKSGAACICQALDNTRNTCHGKDSDNFGTTCIFNDPDNLSEIYFYKGPDNNNCYDCCHSDDDSDAETFPNVASPSHDFPQESVSSEEHLISASEKGCDQRQENCASSQLEHSLEELMHPVNQNRPEKTKRKTRTWQQDYESLQAMFDVVRPTNSIKSVIGANGVQASTNSQSADGVICESVIKYETSSTTFQQGKEFHFDNNLDDQIEDIVPLNVQIINRYFNNKFRSQVINKLNSNTKITNERPKSETEQIAGTTVTKQRDCNILSDQLLDYPTTSAKSSEDNKTKDQNIEGRKDAPIVGKPTTMDEGAIISVKSSKLHRILSKRADGGPSDFISQEKQAQAIDSSGSQVGKSKPAARDSLLNSQTSEKVYRIVLTSCLRKARAAMLQARLKSLSTILRKIKGMFYGQKNHHKLATKESHTSEEISGLGATQQPSDVGGGLHSPGASRATTHHRVKSTVPERRSSRPIWDLEEGAHSQKHLAHCSRSRHFLSQGSSLTNTATLSQKFGDKSNLAHDHECQSQGEVAYKRTEDSLQCPTAKTESSNGDENRTKQEPTCRRCGLPATRERQEPNDTRAVSASIVRQSSPFLETITEVDTLSEESKLNNLSNDVEYGRIRETDTFQPVFPLATGESACGPVFPLATGESACGPVFPFATDESACGPVFPFATDESACGKEAAAMLFIIGGRYNDLDKINTAFQSSTSLQDCTKGTQEEHPLCNEESLMCPIKTHSLDDARETARNESSSHNVTTIIRQEVRMKRCPSFHNLSELEDDNFSNRLTIKYGLERRDSKHALVSTQNVQALESSVSKHALVSTQNVQALESSVSKHALVSTQNVQALESSVLSLKDTPIRQSSREPYWPANSPTESAISLAGELIEQNMPVAPEMKQPVTDAMRRTVSKHEASSKCSPNRLISFNELEDDIEKVTILRKCASLYYIEGESRVSSNKLCVNSEQKVAGPRGPFFLRPSGEKHILTGRRTAFVLESYPRIVISTMSNVSPQRLDQPSLTKSHISSLYALDKEIVKFDPCQVCQGCPELSANQNPLCSLSRCTVGDLQNKESEKNYFRTQQSKIYINPGDTTHKTGRIFNAGNTHRSYKQSFPNAMDKVMYLSMPLVANYKFERHTLNRMLLFIQGFSHFPFERLHTETTDVTYGICSAIIAPGSGEQMERNASRSAKIELYSDHTCDGHSDFGQSFLEGGDMERVRRQERRLFVNILSQLLLEPSISMGEDAETSYISKRDALARQALQALRRVLDISGGTKSDDYSSICSNSYGDTCNSCLSDVDSDKMVETYQQSSSLDQLIQSNKNSPDSCPFSGNESFKTSSINNIISYIESKRENAKSGATSAKILVTDAKNNIVKHTMAKFETFNSEISSPKTLTTGYTKHRAIYTNGKCGATKSRSGTPNYNDSLITDSNFGKFKSKTLKPQQRHSLVNDMDSKSETLNSKSLAPTEECASFTNEATKKYKTIMPKDKKCVLTCTDANFRHSKSGSVLAKTLNVQKYNSPNFKASLHPTLFGTQRPFSKIKITSSGNTQMVGNDSPIRYRQTIPFSAIDLNSYKNDNLFPVSTVSPIIGAENESPPAIEISARNNRSSRIDNIPKPFREATHCTRLGLFNAKQCTRLGLFNAKQSTRLDLFNAKHCTRFDLFNAKHCTRLGLSRARRKQMNANDILSGSLTVPRRYKKHETVSETFAPSNKNYRLRELQKSVNEKTASSNKDSIARFPSRIDTNLTCANKDSIARFPSRIDTNLTCANKDSSLCELQSRVDEKFNSPNKISNVHEYQPRFEVAEQTCAYRDTKPSPLVEYEQVYMSKLERPKVNETSGDTAGNTLPTKNLIEYRRRHRPFREDSLFELSVHSEPYCFTRASTLGSWSHRSHRIDHQKTPKRQSYRMRLSSQSSYKRQDFASRSRRHLERCDELIQRSAEIIATSKEMALFCQRQMENTAQKMNLQTCNISSNLSANNRV